jgi:hypothetical protein
MKKIELDFNRYNKLHPDWSTLTCFNLAIAWREYTKRMVSLYLRKLVDKEDYEPVGPDEIIESSVILSLTNNQKLVK